MRTTFAEIQTQMRQAELLQFGLIEDAVRARNPEYTEAMVATAARRRAREQILAIMALKDEAKEYAALRQYFMQTIGGEYLRLPINCKYQANLQRSKALQRLLKEGFLKMGRARGSIGFGLKGIGQYRGWKPYGTHQTYLTLSENSCVHIRAVDV